MPGRLQVNGQAGLEQKSTIQLISGYAPPFQSEK
tara:strand:+ start:521 stop:622 length:102 start_codon:yes stop_codon:yes gene_type:complete